MGWTGGPGRPLGALGLFSEADGEPWEDYEERRTMS